MDKLRSAMELAHRCGARRLEERCRRELIAFGARSPDRDNRRRGTHRQ